MTNPTRYFVEVFDKLGHRRKTIAGSNKKELKAEAARQAGIQDTFRPHLAPHTVGAITNGA